MNKKAIWAIIGLMSAAMVGIIFLQVHWIKLNVGFTEKRFDENVKDAILKVAYRLETAEDQATYDDLFDEGVRSPSFSSPQIKGQFQSKTELTELSISQSFGKGQLAPVSVNQLSINKTPDFSYIREKMEYQQVQKLLNLKSLEERINLELLEGLLYNELKKRDIDAKYNYGIFSNRQGAFVINNGSYTVVNDNFSSIENVDNELYNSSYQTELFSNSNALVEAPGLLMVHFPNRTSVIWSSSWKSLLASIFFTGLILFCFSYTILVILEQKKVSEMKTDFINNMTHEFKTPIATISLAADSITSPMISGNADKVKRFADIIRQENKRMNNQVEKVLQMALIDKKEYKLKMAQVNLHDVINQAVQNSNLQVEKKLGSVSAILEASNPYVFGDLTHISNIVNNLLDNANKYSPEKPQISVRTRNVAQGVEVIIKDNGIGMSREALKHIFDKFFRVHTGNRHDVKGFGLGLSYVKALMDAHKGNIDVKSDLGKGSTFILTFPFNNVPSTPGQLG